MGESDRNREQKYKVPARQVPDKTTATLAGPHGKRADAPVEVGTDLHTEQKHKVLSRQVPHKTTATHAGPHDERAIELVLARPPTGPQSQLREWPLRCSVPSRYCTEFGRKEIKNSPNPRCRAEVM